MPTYAVVTMNMASRDWTASYLQPARELMAKHGGRYFIPVGQFERIEGEHTPTAVTVLEFPSREAFFAFYNDPAYEPLKKVRLANTVGSMYLIDSDGPVDPLSLS